MHDPTTINRQGLDVGSQYGSAIFTHSDGQHVAAEALKKQLNETFYQHQPIITEITEAVKFYDAEEYHQCYLEKKGLGSRH